MWIGGGYVIKSLNGAKRITIKDFSYTTRSGSCTVLMKIDDTNLPLSNGSYSLDNNSSFLAQSTAISNVNAEQIRITFKLVVEY